MSFRVIYSFIFILILLPGVAGADGKSQELTGNEFYNIFHAYVTGQSPWPAADMEIQKFRARPNKITLPDGKIDYRVAGKVPEIHPGFKTIDLIISVGGEYQERVKLSGELHVFGEVLCIVKKMGRGEVVRKEDVRMVRRDLTWQSEGVVSDPDMIVGKRLKSSLRAGSVLMERHLEERPLVLRGDTVTIIAGRAPLLVSTPGRVKNAGASGELVRVKNLMSRKILLARVRDDRTVVVEY